MARKGQLQKAVTINGVRKFFYGKTYEEIEEKIQKYQNGTQLDFCKEYEDWLYTIKKFTVKESTFDRLETTYRTMIKSKFGRMGLDNVSARFVQTYINQLAKTYSYSSVKKCYEALNEFYKHMVKYKVISENPIEFVTIPRKEYYEVKEKVIEIPSREDVQRLIDYTYSIKENGEYRFCQVHTHGIILIIYTGLRAGELLALKWSDIDFDKKEMRINSTMARVKVRDRRKKTKYEEKENEPKTKNGKRTVYLNRKAVEALQAIKEYQNGTCEHVMSVRGSPITYASLLKILYRVQDAAGLARHGLHIYRHYFASECLTLGIKPIELSRMLGHARVNITLDIYGHLTETMKDDVKSRLELM